MTDVEWVVSSYPINYEAALTEMEARIATIRDDKSKELVWLLEHPPLYTAGSSANSADLVNKRFPVYEAGRGGQYTYHGPGQRVAYVMLDLKKRQTEPDVRRYVWQLEEWIIRALAHFDVMGERREGRVGIWVTHPPLSDTSRSDGVEREASLKESKIAAIGVRIRHWVAYHGISINVNPDLSHYDGIIPCGIAEHGVTSLADLGKDVTLEQLDAALQAEFAGVFG